jgi:hypothetical protein
MTNHPHRSAVAKESVPFCERLFSHVGGRARIRLGGELPGYDEKRGEVFVKSYDKPTRSMPAYEFRNHLTTEEIAQLESLPFWNGNNEYELSLALLRSANAAIDRYHGRR